MTKDEIITINFLEFIDILFQQSVEYVVLPKQLSHIAILLSIKDENEIYIHVEEQEDGTYQIWRSSFWRQSSERIARRQAESAEERRIYNIHSESAQILYTNLCKLLGEPKSTLKRKQFLGLAHQLLASGDKEVWKRFGLDLDELPELPRMTDKQQALLEAFGKLLSKFEGKEYKV